MRKKFEEVLFVEASLKGDPAVFTLSRVERSSIPEGLHMYEIKHASGNIHRPVSIGNAVLVNFYGTLVSPIDLGLENTTGSSIPYKKNVECFEYPRISGAEFFRQHTEKMQETFETDPLEFQSI